MNPNKPMRRESGRHPRRLAKLAAACVLLAGHALALADGPPRFSRAMEPIEAKEAAPDALKDINVKEHLGSKIPLDLTFTDDKGQTVQLAKYFSGKKPVILQLGYLGCPMLCGLVSQGTVDSLRKLTLTANKDFDIVFVSIDPTEKSDLAADKKETYAQDYHREGSRDGFHFLVGQEEQIKRLTQAVGFEYKWVESARQYSHPAVLVIATPDGTISRYLYGVRFDNQTLRLSLVEASDGKVGTAMDQILLTCFQYDGKQGKYAMTAVNLMRAGGAVTVVGLAGVLLFAFRHDLRRSRQAATPAVDNDSMAR